MATETKDFYFAQLKHDGIAQWEAMAGCPLNQVLKPGVWMIDYQNARIGIRASELSVIEFDRIFGSLADYKSLSFLPKFLMDQEVLTFEKNIQGVKKLFGGIFKRFDPLNGTDLMKHFYGVTRVRFEAIALILVDVIASQELTIRDLGRREKENQSRAVYEMAYRDLLARCPKNIRDEHIQLNPAFLRILNEDVHVISGTTMN